MIHDKCCTNQAKTNQIFAANGACLYELRRHLSIICDYYRKFGFNISVHTLSTHNTTQCQAKIIESFRFNHISIARFFFHVLNPINPNEIANKIAHTLLYKRNFVPLFLCCFRWCPSFTSFIHISLVGMTKKKRRLTFDKNALRKRREHRKIV